MEKEIKQQKKKRITLEVSLEDHTKLKLAAVSRNMTIKEIIEEALFYYKEYLKKKNI